ncbi:MAG TPA: family 43 glycosylhydrolase [Bacteroidota bacterium]|nr:family 43 glycosylhydrolase [Bacteroidota bacterium]
MKTYNSSLRLLAVAALVCVTTAAAQNPLIMDQFTADPTARVFEGKMYVYPSHDILAAPGRGRVGWFCMADYHVFSSDNLTDWKDHGVIVSQQNVPWVDSTSYSMWAPDCVYKDGKYYFYFPAGAMDKGKRRGMSIGVAVSDTPYGPFTPEAKPIEGVTGIDPNVLIDKDGQAYMYWAARGIAVAKLKPNMRELASAPLQLEGLPGGFKEGPFPFERNGIYYLTFPNVIDSTESLVYCTSKDPMGPFTYGGVLMDKWPNGCWTNHQSVVEYQGQWYLFYHHNDLSPNFDKARSIRADSLFFNPDGSIKKVIPTWRGVGRSDARKKIQIDRYSDISNEGVAVSFLTPENPHEGWKIGLSKKNAWVKYNSVDFGATPVKSIEVQSSSATGGAIEIRLDALDGPVLARVDIAKTPLWDTAKAQVSTIPTGVHNLVVVQKDPGAVELDWITFK